MLTRVFELLLLAISLTVSLAPASGADVFAYEVVGVGGPNDVVDSNAASCDSVEGCYTRSGTRCSDDPNRLCDLQIVPIGRCTYGDLSTGLASCVWPHRAGRCIANPKVGCLTSEQCAGLTPGTCDLSVDKFGRPADPNDAASCTCQRTNPPGADFETAICGGVLSICSDGDPDREVGGFGTGIGTEIKVGGPGSQLFAELGPAVTGATLPTSSPVYAIENPPTSFDPMRDAGTVARPAQLAQGTGQVRRPRTTDAREILPYAHPTIATATDVRKAKKFGDSYWSDWVFRSVPVSGTFNEHHVTVACLPPANWVVGTPVNGGLHCHQNARDSFGFLWGSDLTPAQLADYTVGGTPVCPPNCYKDFALSTMELEELNQVAAQDPNAAIQLAMQSGEPAPSRRAGERDAIEVSVVTRLIFLVDNDLRCRIGGWGNPPGLVGRCNDGPRACAPGPAGDAACAAPPSNGGSCRACVGPFDAITNPLGLPIGYNTHGRPELDLVAGQRIGGIAGQNADVRMPLILIGTTGSAAADFRDLANEGLPNVDLNDLGPASTSNPSCPGGLCTFAPGIGAGGTFVNGLDLNIDEPCCAGGANVSWDAAQLGVVTPGLEDGFSYRYGPAIGDVELSDWALTHDKGPGPDGIPGCIGDNRNTTNGVAACDTRLGAGPVGPKTDPFFATGQDDRAILYPVGAAVRPASASRFLWRDPLPAVNDYYGGVESPPIVNTVSAFTLRDLAWFVPRSADLLAKVNTTACPLTDQGAQCGQTDPVCNCTGAGGDVDSDCVCGDVDNCDQVANPLQTNSDSDSLGDACDNCDVVSNETQTNSDADPLGDACDNCPTLTNGGQQDGGSGIEIPADGVGDVCDNCVFVSNPRPLAGYLDTNPWRTLTGGQIDDDHDGYGNVCDGKFVGSPSHNVGGLDLGEFRASENEDRRSDDCGSDGTRPCAIFDLDEAPEGHVIGGLDLGQLRALSNRRPGPRCAACTGTASVLLPCTAGTAGTCF